MFRFIRLWRDWIFPYHNYPAAESECYFEKRYNILTTREAPDEGKSRNVDNNFFYF